MDSATKGRAIYWMIAALILVSFLGLRATHRDFDRPFEWDELTTLRYFTWVGVEAEGEPRPLDRLEDIHAVGRPGARELAIGLYCSLGRWPEPGNHVVHSLVSNFTTGLLTPSEASLRWSALVGTAAFGWVLFWLFSVSLQWRVAAHGTLILALWCPFVWRYSATARGYTWLFALQILLLVLLLRLPRRLASIAATGMAVLVAVLCFVNHLTMAAYWVFPVYLAFWLLTPDERGRSGELTGRERFLFRRNLVMQMLAVGAVAFMFVIDRLPYIFASAGGAAIDRGSDVLNLSGIADGLGATLFPGAVWKVLAVVGLLGLVLAPRRSARRTILTVAAIGSAVAVVHLAVSGRTPPARALSWVIPVVLVGLTGLVDGLSLKLPSRQARVWASVAWVAVCGALAWVGFKGLPSRSALEDLVESIVEQDLDGDPGTLVLLDKRVGPVVPLYFPRGWKGVEQPPQEGDSRLLTIVRDTGSYGRLLATRDQDHVVAPWEPLSWPEAEELETGGVEYRLVEIPGRVVRFQAEEGLARALVFWYLPIESVAVRPQKVLEHLEDFSLRYMTVKVPFPAKLEVFFRLGCLVFPADSPGELAEIERAVATGLDRYGGEVRVFTPEPSDQ